MTEELHDELIFVGYTNGYQILYGVDSPGSFYPDTDNGTIIPLYMLKTHAHRIQSTTNMTVSLEAIKEVRNKTINNVKFKRE